MGSESKPQTVRIRNTSVQADPWHGSMSQMEQILSATNPQAVDQAGDAYVATSKRFSTTADLLRKHAVTLANVWKGKDADEAQKQMQRLHATSREMDYRSYQTGRALKDHAEKLQWYKDNRPKEGFLKGIDVGDVAAFTFGGFTGVAAKRAFVGSEEDNAAREHMDRLQTRTVEANNYIPEDLTTDLPAARGGVDEGPQKPPSPSYPSGGGLPSGGGGGGNLPKDPFGSGGGGGNLPKDPFGSGGGGGNLPKDPFGSGGFGSGGSGTSLAGLNPSGAGGGGLGGDPFGRSGLGGGLAGGAGVGGGLGGGAGVGGLAGGVPGSKAGRFAGKGGGSHGTGGMTGGGPAAGMGAGGRGGGKGGDEEHERTTWLTEDEDVWGGNDDDTAPPVIG